MNTAKINISGVIGGELGIDGENVCTYQDVLSQIHEAKDADILKVVVDSIGGYCDIADKIIKALVDTGKQIITENAGDVASAASKIFTIPANKENRLFNPKLGVFLPHNPFTPHVEGDADYIANYAKELKTLETDYEKWYSEKTGVDKNIISELMAQDTPLTTEQIEKFGFAKIVSSEFQAIAKIKKVDKMDKKEFDEKMSKFDKFLAKIDSLLGGVKAVMVVDANGAEIEFPDVNTPEEIIIGVKTTAQDGSYVMPSGETYVIAGGVLTEIIAVADDMEALRGENEQLKSELEALKAEKATAETKATEAAEAVSELETVKAEFMALKKDLGKFSNFKTETPKPQTKEETSSRIAAKRKK